MIDGIAQFAIAHPVEIASLLEDSTKAGLELVDVSLRKPNLESVFLHLTGKGDARLIFAIVHTAMLSLRRDRGALALSFILPVVFFSIFAVIFGGRRDSTPKVSVIIVDEDHSRASQRLVKDFQSKGSLTVKTRHVPVKGTEQPEYTAATAEAAVRAGKAPVALIIPHGFGDNPISFGPGSASRPASDVIAPQVIAGLLQKVAMMSTPDVMAEQGSRYFDQFTGGLTREQRDRVDSNLRSLREREESGATTAASGASGNEGIIALTTRAVVDENKNNPWFRSTLPRLA